MGHGGYKRLVELMPWWEAIGASHQGSFFRFSLFTEKKTKKKEKKMGIRINKYKNK